MTSRMAGRILVTALLISPLAARAQSDDFPFLEATVAQLQARMASGALTSVRLTRAYIERIHQLDSSANGVNAIIELNPDALTIAQHMDNMRRAGHVLGPLHGIPVLLKANIDTADRMQTTAGSLALQGTPPTHDSTIAANLRAGGAVILGKTNLSEWANFRSFESISGWSGIGGQTHNPYGIDRNPCGSSSGSGAAASANFATVSLGTETDGSVVCPGNANGVVGLKPTIGLTSRAGVVPISHTQDTVGVHARTVADAAVTLGVIQSRTSDGRDPATGGVPLGWQGTGKARPTNIPTEYTKFLDPNGLRGAVLGITRQGLNGFDSFVPTPAPVTAAVAAAFKALTDAGATLVDLDALVSATDNPAWATDLVFGDHFIFGTSSIAAAGGYPIVQVPAGEVFGVPLGISFFGTAFSEPELIKLASGYEAFTHARAHNLPTFAATVPFEQIKAPRHQSAGEGSATGSAMQSGSSAVSSSAVQSAAAAPAAAAVATPGQSMSAKARKVLHHL